jgi:aspartate-semialdehyde dehydrogenase
LGLFVLHCGFWINRHVVLLTTIITTYFLSQSAFRYLPHIPLVVPEINGQCTKGKKLIANPNCTTAIGLMALWPLHQLFGLKKIIMATYQAASGAGQEGMDELLDGTKVYLDGGKAKNTIFAHPLPFNVIPQIDKFQENGYTKEEMKVAWECRKICGLPDDFPVSYVSLSSFFFVVGCILCCLALFCLMCR